MQTAQSSLCMMRELPATAISGSEQVVVVVMCIHGERMQHVAGLVHDTPSQDACQQQPTWYYLFSLFVPLQF